MTDVGCGGLAIATRAVRAAPVAGLGAAWTVHAHRLIPTPPPEGLDLGATEIRGYVFDGSAGARVGLAGARVDFHVAGVRPNAVAITDGDGAFTATLDLRADDWIVVEASHVDFVSASLAQTGIELWQDPRLEFVLQRRLPTEIRGR